VDLVLLEICRIMLALDRLKSTGVTLFYLLLKKKFCNKRR